MKLLLVAGARPNFMKIAPIVRALRARHEAEKLRRLKDGVVRSDKIDQTNQIDKIDYRIVHTGQHYDYAMSGSFFSELEIPAPDYYLGAGSGTHAEQTARIMVGFEKVCAEVAPDVVAVVGDVNSTLACSITAKKLGVAVAHVEAGLRSRDMTMPEEINRIVTDSISDYLFVTERAGLHNLVREGRPDDSIFLVGHVMVDNLLHQMQGLARVDPSRFSTFPLKSRLKSYIFLTLHRPSNVDDGDTLRELAEALNEIARDVPIIFPVHPRTRNQLNTYNIKLNTAIHLLSPLSFRESLFLWKDALLVVTDSGGLQEETTAIGIPCFTVRENTERPITVEEGTNTLVGTSGIGILQAWQDFRVGNRKTGSVPELWDGHAAERIVEILCQQCN